MPGVGADSSPSSRAPISWPSASGRNCENRLLIVRRNSILSVDAAVGKPNKAHKERQHQASCAAQSLRLTDAKPTAIRYSRKATGVYRCERRCQRQGAGGGFVARGVMSHLGLTVAKALVQPSEFWSDRIVL